MLRGLIKDAVAVAFKAAGTERLVTMACGRKDPLLVIGYHQVVPEFRPDWRCGIPAMQISCAMLENHLDWIGSRYDFVTLDQIGQHLESGEPFRRPVAALTFDDGYRDVYLNAFPLLKRKGIPAAVFVVTGIVDTETPPLHDRLYGAFVAGFQQWGNPGQKLFEQLSRLDIPPLSMKRILAKVPNAFSTMRAVLDLLRHREIEALVTGLELTTVPVRSSIDEALPLTWEMLREMSAAGVTIGSHTKSHILLTAENSPRVYEEVGDSKSALDQNLGTATRHFAYPDGRFNVNTAHAVAATGYRYAYTTCRHQLAAYPMMTIPRKMLWERSCTDSAGRFSEGVMNGHALGVFDWISGCDRAHGEVTNARRGAWRAYGRTNRADWTGGLDS